MMPLNGEGSSRSFYNVSLQLRALGQEVSKFHSEVEKIIQKIQVLPSLVQDVEGKKEPMCIVPLKPKKGKAGKLQECVVETSPEAVSSRPSSPPILGVELADWKIPEGIALVKKIEKIVNTFSSMGILSNEVDFSRLQGAVSADCERLRNVVQSERDRLAPFSNPNPAQLVCKGLGWSTYDGERYFQHLLGALGGDPVGSGSDLEE